MSMKKPAVIRALEGNPGRRPIEESGIEALGEPFIPEHLADDARGCIEVIRQFSVRHGVGASQTGSTQDQCA